MLTTKSFHTSNPVPEQAIDRTVPDLPPAQLSDEDKYFTTLKPPSYLAEILELVKQFVGFHENLGKPVVLVTLGGTTVPLENNTVRFIDNFSAGTRGATLAEYFLENGYAVVFLHREFSLLPYLRHYSHTTNCFLDYMTEIDGKIGINPEYAPEMLKVMRKYTQARDLNSLLLIPFTTVNQYLYTLREIAELMRQLETRALFYLAAAVLDFFLPSLQMPQHKIQLRDQEGGKLVVNLEQVPKFLLRLVENWAPLAMIVLFKLETDELILIKKARQALDKYQHQLVIGNLLQTRKKEVVFVTSDNEEKWIKLTPEEIEAEKEIESLIIPAVIRQHQEWIKAKHN